MRERLITFTVLILAILLLRVLFRKTISRRTLLALVPALGLAALTCACTFAGGRAGPAPLTGEELAYFNETYFNGEGYNLRNQFLSSLYDAPEEINLFELFYCGTGNEVFAGPEERQAVIDAGYGGMAPDCGCTKNPAADVDALLIQYMGLTAEQTNGVGLERFTCLTGYDAYYHFHGDTNYRGQVTFTSGEREGDAVRLYYDDSFYGDGPKVLTLTDLGDGEYRFVSNVRDSSRPGWDPERSFDLTDGPECGGTRVEPVDAPGVEPLSSEAPPPILDRVELDGVTVLCWQDEEATYCSYRREGEPQQTCFLSISYDMSMRTLSLDRFTDVLGRDGFTVLYPSSNSGYETAYYYFDETGALCLLAAVDGILWEPDLDGDGQRELLWRGDGLAAPRRVRYLYESGGRTRLVNLTELLGEEVCPDGGDWNLYCLGERPDHIRLDAAQAERRLYFDGGTLDLYRMLTE